MQYRIINDLGLPFCFIGTTYHNHTLYNYFNGDRPCEHVSLEYVCQQDQTWFDKRQFMAVVTSVAFKKQIVESLNSRQINWVSVVSENTHIGHNVKIGRNTFVNNFNSIYDGVDIGDHCTITNFLSLSHCVTIKDYCHVSPYCYLCFTTLDQGVCVGVRSAFTGTPQQPIYVAPWSNFMLGSNVSGSIPMSGTYAGRRKQSDQTSLTFKIF